MITGAMLRDAIISASNNIGNYKSAVDELNVFPVPDGDTGTNMSLTISAAAKELLLVDDHAPISKVAEITASALLRGARGNSGVILSLIFRGLEKGLRGCVEATGATISAALTLGVEQAYKAVMKPVEGTILTVVRIAAETAVKRISADTPAVEVWETICVAASVALDDTPNLLPVLKKAKVVDAGGKGLLLIFEGMLSVFKDGKIVESLEGTETETILRTYSELAEDIKYTYCTEFLISRHPDTLLDAMLLRAYLESIGDSVVVVEDEDIIKVHVHTNEPGNAISKALDYGMLTNVKIDNMRQQHHNATWGSSKANIEGNDKASIAEPEKQYGIVAVAAGDGLNDLFISLGADNVVSGGQTMNPSTNDILRAIDLTPAEIVFVLPNNKNIIMTAEQTVNLSTKEVRVINTKSIPEGISGMLEFDPEETPENNHINMQKAAERVQTAQVTFAARDSIVNGQNVHKGDMLGMENGKITVVEDNPVHAAYRTTKHLLKKSTSIITVFYGEGITEEQAQELESMLRNKISSSIEILMVKGGQPVYYFIVSIE